MVKLARTLTNGEYWDFRVKFADDQAWSVKAYADIRMWSKNKGAAAGKMRVGLEVAGGSSTNTMDTLSIPAAAASDPFLPLSGQGLDPVRAGGVGERGIHPKLRTLVPAAFFGFLFSHPRADPGIALPDLFVLGSLAGGTRGKSIRNTRAWACGIEIAAVPFLVIHASRMSRVYGNGRGSEVVLVFAAIALSAAVLAAPSLIPFPAESRRVLPPDPSGQRPSP